MSMSSHSTDLLIIGAGIVGCATALTCAKRFQLKITVVDQEHVPGFHQTGHNSGVIHSGIYYKPGSLKARLCISGREKLIQFCQENDIPYKLTGKLIVAVQPSELERLHALEKNGRANGIPNIELLTESDIRKIEPHLRGIEALYIPTTGLVSYPLVVQKICHILEKSGHTHFFGERVESIRYQNDVWVVRTPVREIQAKWVMNCGGLEADRVANLFGIQPTVRIIPFRGMYWRIVDPPEKFCQLPIYPVPDPELPFLGIHFTPTFEGDVLLGPNALLTLSRYGYGGFRISLKDTWDMVRFKGFWRMLWKVRHHAFQELKTLLYPGRLVLLSKQYYPFLTKKRMKKGPDGIRAQAVDDHGNLVMDFVIEHVDKSIHVLNAPSPAATSSFAIAEEITRHLQNVLE